MKKIFKIIFAFFVLSFLIGVYFFLRSFYFSENLANKEVVFEIRVGESLFSVARNLEKEGLIKNKIFFILKAILEKKYSKFQTGKYLLNSLMGDSEIIKKFVLGDVLRIKVTIPEGYTLKQIETELTQKFQKEIKCDFKVKDFKDEYSFLDEIPEDLSLEGFLFPDTYYFLPESDKKTICKKFLDNFDKKLSENLRKDIKNQKKSLFEVIIMASLLEKEVKTKEDKEIVAGILWKRLENNMPLQVDATIAYLLDQPVQRITFQELQIDSPYNTYKYLGLPPGPISNPGLESILAAVYYRESDYWYYLSAPDGKTVFSKTYEEHLIAKNKYLK